jgi:hypothetical protein
VRQSAQGIGTLIAREIRLCLAFQAWLGGALAFSAETAPPGGGQRFAAAPAAEGNTSSAKQAGGWRLIRSAKPDAEPGAAAILHTADFERSDPRIAGLMLQCGAHGVEAMIVVVEPFPPHAQLQVTLRTPDQESHFTSSAVPTGAGVRLADDVTVLAHGWRKARELELKVTEGDAEVGGVVDLAGFPKALEWLTAECMKK